MALSQHSRDEKPLWSAETLQAWERPGGRLRFVQILEEFFFTEKTYFDNIKNFSTAMRSEFAKLKENGKLNSADELYYSSVLSSFEQMVTNNPFISSESLKNYQIIVQLKPQLQELSKKYAAIPEIAELDKLVSNLNAMKRMDTTDMDNETKKTHNEEIQQQEKIVAERKAAIQANPSAELAEVMRQIKSIESAMDKPLRGLYEVINSAYIENARIEEYKELKKLLDNQSVFEQRRSESRDDPLIAEIADTHKQNIADKEKKLGMSIKARMDEIEKTTTNFMTKLNNPDRADVSQMDQYVSASRSFVDQFDSTITFTREVLQKNYPQISTAILNNPQFNKLGIADFHIMPVQRFPRYKLLLEDLRKHTVGAEYKAFSENAARAGQIADAMNSSRSTTPLKVMSYVIVSEMMRNITSEITRRNQATPNNFRLQMFAKKYEGLNNFLANMRIEDDKKILATIRTLKDLPMTEEQKASYISKLDPHSQMLFHVLEMIDKNKDNGLAVARLEDVKNKVLSLMQKKEVYKAVVTMREAYITLRDQDVFGIVPRTHILEAIEAEKNQLSIEMTRLDQELNTAIKTHIIPLMTSTDSLASTKSMRESSAQRATSSAEDLVKSTTQTSLQSTTLPPRPQTSSTTPPLAATTSQPRSQLKSTMNPQAGAKLSPVNVMALFKNVSHLETFRQGLRAEVSNRLTVDQALSETALVKDTLEKINNKKNDFSAINMEFINLAVTELSTKSSSLSEIAGRNDELSIYAKKWSENTEEYLSDNRAKLSSSLNKAIAITERLNGLAELELRLRNYENDITKLYEPLHDKALKNYITKETLNTMDGAVIDVQGIKKLRDQIKTEQLKLLSQLEVEKQKITKLDSALNHQFLVNTENLTIKEFETQVLQQNADFQHLKNQVGLQLQTKTESGVAKLAELIPKTNYVGYLARKWSQETSPNMETNLIRLNLGLNRIETNRQSLQKLEDLERKLHDVRRQKSVAREKQKAFSDHFTKENKKGLETVGRIIDRIDDNALDKLQKDIQTKKQALEKEIRREQVNVGEQDKGLDEIRRKNAVKNEGSPREQAVRFAQAFYAEFDQLRIKLDYLATHPQFITQSQMKMELDSVRKAMQDLQGKVHDCMEDPQKLHELQKELASTNLSASSLTRDMVKGFDKGIEKLSDNNSHLRKTNAKQIEKLEVKVMKQKDLTKSQVFGAKLNAVSEYCTKMLKLLEEREGFVHGAEAARNKQLMAAYTSILDKAQKCHTEFHPNGIFSYSSKPQEMLKSLLRSPELQVNSGLRNTLKQVYDGVDQEIKAREKYVRTSKEVSSSPALQKESEKMREKITRSTYQGHGLYESTDKQTSPQPSRNTPKLRRGNSS